ncbi:hypothetical protein JCM3774_000757 [Rhodotorula dairenensis]
MNSSSMTLNGELDPLRLRLVQLIDAVSHLSAQLEHLAYAQPQPHLHLQLPPFTDLVSRYNLLVTHLSAIQRLVSSEQDQHQLRLAAEAVPSSTATRRFEALHADPKRDKWDALAVVPATRIDEARDWIVGTLLRTKQTPEVELAQQTAASALPEPFLSALNPASSSAPSSPSFASLSQAQARLVTLAHQKIIALKQFSSSGGGGEIDEYDWKARVELDDDDDDDNDDNDVDADDRLSKETPMPSGAGTWTLQDFYAFMQTGKRPAPLPRTTSTL